MNQEHRRPDDHGPDSEHDDDDGVTLEVFERIVEGGRAVRRKGIYLLPNFFTTAALFFGFSAIVEAFHQDWKWAAIKVFVAGIMDGLDGRVARMTNTQSAFGAQYDSLSDAVAFGLAPGVVVFAWALNDLGKIGFAIAFIYAACTVLRLARFNVQLGSGDKRYFTGLPSPAGAAIVAGMVWVAVEGGVKVDHFVSVGAAIITAAAAVLMVSNVRFYSFKDLHAGPVPLFVLLIAVLVIALIYQDPPTALWGVVLVYAASGPFGALYRRMTRKRDDAGHS